MRLRHMVAASGGEMLNPWGEGSGGINTDLKIQTLRVRMALLSRQIRDLERVEATGALSRVILANEWPRFRHSEP